MDDRKYRLSLLAIIEAGAILRLWGLGQLQLWYDECFTLLAARQDFPTMIRATMTDVHPPLLYILQWGLIRLFGEYSWVMRLPSALLSIAALFLTWKLGERLKISRPAILAALAFLSVNTVQLWYSQEARMYAIFQFLVLCQALLILQRRWAPLSFTLLVMLWLHNYGLIFLPVMGLFALWQIRKEIEAELPAVLIAFIVPVLLWFPWVWVLASQMGMVAQGYWIAPINLGEVVYDMNGVFWGIVSKEPIDSIVVLIGVGMFSLTIIRACQRREHGSLLWLALAPLGLAVVISLVWKPILLFRGLIGCVPPLTLAIMETLAGARQTVTHRAIAAAILVPALICMQFTYWMGHTSAKGMDRVVAQNTILPEYREGDVVMHLNDGTAVMLMALTPGLPQIELKTSCHPPVGALSDATRAELGIKQYSMEEALAKYQRVWFVAGIGSTSYKCEEDYFRNLSAWGEQKFQGEQSKYMTSGVWLYDLSKQSHYSR